MKRLILIGLLVSACGSSPTAPTPAPVIPPAPTMITITGHVSATNGGQPLGGLSAALGATTATTDGGGSFTASMLPTASLSLALTGTSIVPRTIRIAAMNTRDVSADAITLGGGFDLGFYRQLVRNAYEGGTEPIRRWTRTPSFYLKTVDEAGEAIHGPTLTLIEATLKEAVPTWTSGVLGTPVVERGTGTREGVSGWITVKFPAEVATTTCGQAQVGVDGGWIVLSYHAPTTATFNCRVPGAVIAPRVVRHEVGHALGFFHTDSPSDLMMGGQWIDPNQQPSARELYHARIAYSRPVGNVDPDNDTGPVYLAPLRVP